MKNALFLFLCACSFVVHTLSALEGMEQKEINSISENLSPLFYEQMKNLKKNELHLHIGGAWPLNYLKEIASEQEFNELSDLFDQIQNKQINYHHAFHAFALINQVVNSDIRVENGVEAICKDLLSDNVVYAELRTGLKDLGSGLEGYLQSVLKGIKKGTHENSLQIGLILSLRRDTKLEIAEKTLELALKYRDQGIVGIDISGDSTQGEGAGIFAVLIKAKSHHFPITLHIGESNEETPNQQMKELTLIQPQRIGHGVHLCEEGKEWVKKNRVLVELCPTSAFQSGMIDEIKDHPALALLLEGHPVAICTDDPLIFNITLSQEYALVAALTAISLEQIEKLQQQNQAYHFLR